MEREKDQSLFYLFARLEYYRRSISYVYSEKLVAFVRDWRSCADHYITEFQNKNNAKKVRRSKDSTNSRVLYFHSTADTFFV